MDVESGRRFLGRKKTTKFKDLVDKRVIKKKVDKSVDLTSHYRFDFRNVKKLDFVLVLTNSMILYSVNLY